MRGAVSGRPRLTAHSLPLPVGEGLKRWRQTPPPASRHPTQPSPSGGDSNFRSQASTSPSGSSVTGSSLPANAARSIRGQAKPSTTTRPKRPPRCRWGFVGLRHSDIDGRSQDQRHARHRGTDGAINVAARRDRPPRSRPPRPWMTASPPPTAPVAARRRGPHCRPEQPGLGSCGIPVAVKVEGIAGGHHQPNHGLETPARSSFSISANGALSEEEVPSTGNARQRDRRSTAGSKSPAIRAISPSTTSTNSSEVKMKVATSWANWTNKPVLADRGPWHRRRRPGPPSSRWRRP